MSDLDLTEALAAGRRGLAERLKWPSMHWGVEDVHPDAWPHVVAASVAAAAPLIEAQVRAQVAAETTDLVQALQTMCDDEWLRRRDRIMRLTGTRYMRDNGAGEIEYAAHMVRRLIGDLPGYDAIATSGAYLDWMRNGRDEGAERTARGESR